MILIGLTIAPLVLVGIVTGRESFSSLRQQSLALESGLVAGKAIEIGAVIEQWENNLLLLDRVHGFGVLELTNQRTILSSLLLHDRLLQEVALVNSRGQEQVRLSRSIVILDDHLKSSRADEAFLFPLTRGITYFGPVLFDESIREPLFTISIPLFDQHSGEVVSVLVAHYRFKKIWDLLAETEIPAEGDIYVTDQAGKVIAHRSPAIVLRGTTTRLQEGERHAKGLSGPDVIIAQERLRFGDQEFVVVGEQSESTALRLANDNVRTLAIVMSSAVVLAITLAVLVARRIVRPIKELAISALAASGGDLSRQVEVTTRDEVGQLALAFNRMLGDLKESRRKLEEYTALELESKNEQLQLGHRQLEEALAELKETQNQIVQQERLRALGQMASGIAHDFNNSLTPIVGYSDLLLTCPEQLENRVTAEGYLRLINTAAQDAANVVRGMREFYRSHEDDEYTAIGLNDIVGQAISLSQAKWKDEAQARGATIVIETDLQDIPPVLGIESQLREVLINLIFNATDAMLNDGTMTIGTRRDGEHVALEVSDTGSGMAEEVRRQCLDPFFTTKGNHGTGMGLAMVYGIVTRHRGTIEIKSRTGEGTTFIIRLPVYTGQPTEQNGASADSIPAPPMHVLVVDDEPMVRQLVADYLTADGHSVGTAANGRDGLEKYLAGSFELVVTDKAMPEMNGDQLASAIKRKTPGKPVIMLTGFGGKIAATGEKPMGVDVVLTKPVKRLELRRALAEAAAEALPVG